MKNKIVLGLNVALILLVFVLNYFYQKSGFDFTLKCVCSLVFALLGLVNLVYSNMVKSRDKGFQSAMARGLLLAFLGDVFIVVNFVAGAFVFALAHVLFIMAYSFLQRPNSLDCILGALIFACSALLLLLCPLFDFGSVAVKVVCVFYALIISLMLGKSLGNLIHNKNLVTGTIALASFLFFFSDLMLVFDKFTKLPHWTSNACMGTYYPAVCLLGLSMYIKTKSQ